MVKSLLRLLPKLDILILNVRTEGDIRSELTFVWDEVLWRSVLDLAILPENLRADMEVS